MTDLITDRFIRPMFRAEALRLCAVSALFFLAGLAVAIAPLLRVDIDQVNDPWLVWVTGPGCVGAAAWYGALLVMREDLFARVVGPTFFVLSMLAAVLSAVGQHIAGAALPEVVTVYAQTVMIVFLVLRRVLANVVVGLCVVASGSVMLTSGVPYAPERWLYTVLPLLAIGYLLGPLPGRAAEAAREVEAARAELARVNDGLAQQVAEQVGQLENAGRLRRFLSPEIAEAVLSDDQLLQPHRREIGVFFSDLRGFTAFAGRAEPEEVLAVLNEYYAAVGSVLRRHGATIGDYAGDGVMAFLGDPVPVEDTARRALVCAGEVRDALGDLTDLWQRRGHALGAGIGVAYGYASLGVVGFDERRSYAALGSVVNLAARLCSVAADGEVLVDQRTAVAAGVDLPVRGSYNLKGFGEVEVHALIGPSPRDAVAVPTP